MTNEQMIPRRYYRMFLARRKYRDIAQHIGIGGRVVVSTCTKATVYASMDWFVLGKFSVYVRRSKGKECIDYSNLQFVA